MLPGENYTTPIVRAVAVKLVDASGRLSPSKPRPNPSKGAYLRNTSPYCIVISRLYVDGNPWIASITKGPYCPFPLHSSTVRLASCPWETCAAHYFGVPRAGFAPRIETLPLDIIPRAGCDTVASVGIACQ